MKCFAQAALTMQRSDAPVLLSGASGRLPLSLHGVGFSWASSSAGFCTQPRPRCIVRKSPFTAHPMELGAPKLGRTCSMRRLECSSVGAWQHKCEQSLLLLWDHAVLVSFDRERAQHPQHHVSRVLRHRSVGRGALAGPVSYAGTNCSQNVAWAKQQMIMEWELLDQPPSRPDPCVVHSTSAGCGPLCLDIAQANDTATPSELLHHKHCTRAKRGNSTGCR